MALDSPQVFGPLGLVSLFIVIFFFALWMGNMTSPRIRRILDRLGMAIFGRFVQGNYNRQRRIEAAYLETTYKNYAAKTLLFAAMAFISGAILGGLLVTVALVFLEPIVQALSALPSQITAPLGIEEDFQFSLTVGLQWVLVVAVGAIVFGGGSAGLSFVVRWWLPSSTAEVRRRSINEGLTRTTAFMFALSRGGMEFPQILRTLTDHSEVYGETAREYSVAVREMDMFGRDMITALRRMSSRTPSEGFKTFTENLTSVLQSGRDLSGFFKEQFERFRREAEERQDDMLELLSTIAEAYVTMLVAGMLFFITILLIFGLTVSDTLTYLKMTVYVLIPISNIGFALFVQQQLDTFGIGGMGGNAGVQTLKRADISTPMPALPEQGPKRPDGGVTHAREADSRTMLGWYDRLKNFKAALRDPVGVVFWNPVKLLWVTVPIAILMFAVRFPRVIQAEGINIRVLDHLIVQSVLFLIGTYAVARYFHRRHIESIEQATPEFLERVASLNDAGMSVVQAIDRVRGTDLGVLTPEVERIWKDVKTGTTVEDAFLRFGRRVRTRAIARVVTLLTNAMRASGQMGPVVRIAAEQTRAELALRRQRRQQMLTYLIVIYISFLVFLVIILAVNEMLVPSIPETSPVEASGTQAIGVGTGAFGDFGGVDQPAYTLVFFHAALIQAVCAGFVGGQLGEGSVRDGAKHATIMLAIAYVAFIFISSPIASIVADSDEYDRSGAGEENIFYDVGLDGDRLTQIDEISLSEGGFVAVYQADRQGDGINQTFLGVSDYYIAGAHSDIVIQLNSTRVEELVGNETQSIDLRLVPHLDTNGNKEFDFQQPYEPSRNQRDRPYGTPSEGGKPGLSMTALVFENVDVSSVQA